MKITQAMIDKWKDEDANESGFGVGPSTSLSNEEAGLLEEWTHVCTDEQGRALFVDEKGYTVLVCTARGPWGCFVGPLGSKA